MKPQADLMTPAELRALIEAADLAMLEACEKLGVRDRTLRGYLAGESPVPRPVAALARILWSKKR